MACAWRVYGVCMACAWRVHGVCMREARRAARRAACSAVRRRGSAAGCGSASLRCEMLGLGREPADRLRDRDVYDGSHACRSEHLGGAEHDEEELLENVLEKPGARIL